LKIRGPEVFSFRHSVLAVAAITGLWCSDTAGQQSGVGEVGKTGATLQIRVVLPNDRPTDEQLRVDLLGSGGMLITAQMTNSNGMAFFYDVPSGDYRVRVTGPNIQDVLSGFFFLENRMRNHSETVVVQPRVAKSPSVAGLPAIAVVDLNIPKPARKDVEKGVEAFNRGDLDDARKSFEAAIAKHPNYASAYNFLGLTFIQQKDTERGQHAFEKAIELNQNFGEAYTNLAKIYFRQQKLELSEPLLEKAVAADSRNAEALTYLVQVELLGGKYELAAANARRVHNLPHNDYAIVHFMAARALRASNQRSQAISEYKLFLQEAPESKNSSQARQELSQLENLKP
jgi:Tfp pilus assembly protein PilF